MQWFRWYHGTAADMKFGRIARATGQTRERVVFVWAMILEDASDSEERGTFDVEAGDIADVLRCDEADIKAIMDAMADQQLISNSKVIAWERRQPLRDDVAARQRKRRAGNADVTRTPRDSIAPEQTQIQNREEKKERLVAPRGTRLPTNWTIPRDWHEWAKAERPDVDALLEADKFRDFWVAKAGAGGVKLDWLATWRNWVRNANGRPHGKRTDGPSDIEIIADVTRELARQDHGGMG